MSAVAAVTAVAAAAAAAGGARTGDGEARAGEIHAGLWQGALAVCGADLRVSSRQASGTLAALVFFVMVASLFPLAVGPEPALLRAIGAGVVWVAALLAALLSVTRLFADDLADGTLDQLLLAAHPLPLLVLGKVAAHWLGSGALLVAASPLLALQYGLDASACVVLAASLALGTPVLSLMGALGAALTVGLRGAGILLPLLTLPLLAPVLILGAGAVQAAQSGMSAAAHLSLLGALLLLALVGAPLATAAALRISQD